MMISIRRAPIYIFGIIIILLCCYYSRITFYLKGKTTWGNVIRIAIAYSTPRYSYPASVVKFTVDNYDYTFLAETSVNYPKNKVVRVIYDPTNPTEAKALTFLGYWFTPCLYSLLPIVILTSALFSFMSPDQAIKIGFKQNNNQ